MIKTDNYMTAAQVAAVVGVSTPTLNYWYAWKRTNPTHELVQYIPDFVKINKTRYWNSSEVWKLIEFKQKLPQGRGGILGCVTQKYCKKDKARK